MNNKKILLIPYGMSFLLGLKEGTECEIIGFSEKLSINLKRRLLSLGFVCGTKVKVLKYSLKKKTILLELRNYVLTVESNICAEIKVKV